MKRAVFHFSIKDVTPYIDWSYFFHAWGINPKSKQSTAADELRNDANAMLMELEGRYCTHALFALCDSRSDGDNIIIEGRTLPLLRQQHYNEDEPNLCLSDFVSPQNDRIGLFATSVDKNFGAEYSGNDYMRIMAQALADRLAEGTASLLHQMVRTRSELWGYAPDERLNIEQLNREEYQGIRPAIGYPSLPDQSVIFTINDILKMQDAGIEITSNGAMAPHASVCGLMIAHPAARYFAVGNISEEQLEDYSVRCGRDVEEIRRFLQRNLKE